MREIILDIETSGLDYKEGHRIIEIGCVELNKKEVGSHFHRYINPLKTLTEENIKIHGITNEFLEDKPLFEDVAEEFLSFIQDSSIIAHNANFDVGFLNYELEKLSKPQIAKDRVVDTVVIARNRFPGQQVNLDALVKKLKVNTLVDREFHGALKDAKILTDVYLELQGINQMGLQLNERKTEDLNLSGELNLTQIVLTKDETEAHKEFIKNNIPNANWAKEDKSYDAEQMSFDLTDAQYTAKFLLENDDDIDYAFNEKELLKEMLEYIDATYDAHYSQDKYQSTEIIEDMGHGMGFALGKRADVSALPSELQVKENPSPREELGSIWKKT